MQGEIHACLTMTSDASRLNHTNLQSRWFQSFHSRGFRLSVEVVAVVEFHTNTKHEYENIDTNKQVQNDNRKSTSQA
jgi:hypothetical protein